MTTTSGRKGFRLRSMEATLDLGDHTLGAPGQGSARAGLIEITERLRWIPATGEGWDVPIRAVDVVSAKPALGLTFHGLLLVIPKTGVVRVRVTSATPLAPRAALEWAAADARATARLRKQLLKRGAADTSGPTRTEVGAPR
jgi:hypothetical protein